MSAVAVHDHLAYERAFWNDCTNTFGEESKQFVYARCMGLQISYTSFSVYGRRILDVGGGPVSLLLKANDLAEGRIVDPIRWPNWVLLRYAAKNISVDERRGEDMAESGWSECWVYNCLQHCEDPERVIFNARRAAPVIRVFEWIEIAPYEGHPNMLTAEQLRNWLATTGGQVQEHRGESYCYGKSFSGVFRTG